MRKTLKNSFHIKCFKSNSVIDASYNISLFYFWLILSLLYTGVAADDDGDELKMYV